MNTSWFGLYFLTAINLSLKNSNTVGDALPLPSANKFLVANSGDQ